MIFKYDDGGRSETRKGLTGDCVCRAIAIVTQRPYEEVYAELANGNTTQRRSSRSGKRGRTASHGIDTSRVWFREYMSRLNFRWTPTMRVGSGCRVHLRDGELPMGRLVVSLSRHYAAVIDGVVHDTHLDDRDGTRCVYGYWELLDDARRGREMAK